MIKLVLPICQKQAPMISRLVHRLKSFGDMVFRDIVIISPWEDQFEARDLVKFLNPVFKSAELLVIPDVPAFAEWPMVGNHMFYETAKILHEHDNKEPWYFFECDNWPLYPGWLDEMQVEFDEAGKPFYGAMNTTRRTNAAGETVEDGRHMVGTAIYPADFFEKSQALQMLTDSWDVEIQNEIEGAVHETTLIWHGWNCGDYKLVDGKLVGKDFGPHKGRYGDRPVPFGTAVIHGDKNGSLAKIDLTGTGYGKNIH